MPRSSETGAPRKRAVRKRATRTSSSAPARREPRKAASEAAPKRRVAAPKPEVREPERVSDSERKAPTPLASRKALAAQRKRMLIVVGIVLLIGIGSSALVGFTDSGQIDVQETIKARNERVKNNTATEDDLIGGNIELPVQNTNQRSRPQLVGLGDLEVPEPPTSEVASSTATSTDATASSTDAVSATSTDDGSEAAAETPEEPAREEETTEAPESTP